MSRIRIKNKETSILLHINIPELLNEFGINGKILGDEYLCYCPFHDNKNTPSFSLKLGGRKAGLWHCLSTHCGSKGNLVSLISFLSGKDYKQTISLLIERYGDPSDVCVCSKEEVDKIAQRLRGLSIGKNYIPNSKFPLPYDCIKTGVKEYFIKPIENGGRGYSIEDFYKLKTEDVKYCNSGYYAHHIILPIYNNCGEQVAFIARSVEPTKIKYRFPENWNKTGSITIFSSGDGFSPVIVEGPFDGLHVQGIWKRTAIVIFGSDIAVSQVREISKICKKVIIAFDGDLSGRTGTLKAIDLLQSYGIEIEVFDLPNGKDPATINYEEFNQFVATLPTDYKSKHKITGTKL